MPALWENNNSFFLPGGAHCRGCGSRLASRLVVKSLYDISKDVMLFGRTCGGGRSELQTGGRIALDGSGMAGIELGGRLKSIKDKDYVIMSGDGRALDMGFGDFCTTFDRNQQVMWVILDNQAYASSGSHSTLTTPLKAQTLIQTDGKPLPERNVPLMMTMSKARYVATASPAFVRDLVLKVKKALCNKPSYLHILCPCIVSWKMKPDQTISLSRKAVQSGLFPLWEFENGVFRRTVKQFDNTPIEDFLKAQKRFSNLTEEGLLEIKNYIASMNQLLGKMEKGFS